MAKSVERLLQRPFADEIELPHQSKNGRLRRFLIGIDRKTLEIHGSFSDPRYFPAGSIGTVERLRRVYNPLQSF
jgi:hypothetical protein